MVIPTSRREAGTEEVGFVVEVGEVWTEAMKLSESIAREKGLHGGENRSKLIVWSNQLLVYQKCRNSNNFDKLVKCDGCLHCLIYDSWLHVI